MEHSLVILGLPLSDWEHVAKVLGVAGALVFFIYKVVSGYLITNMTLRLDCVRRPTADEASDDLRISVTVIKGDRGTVAIHDAAVQLSPASGPPFATVALHSLERQSYRSEDSAGKSRKRIRWDKHSSESPFLNLSPGEEMTFGAYHRIPSTDVCRVEAIVLGKRTTSPAVAQWRGSAFVLPLTPKERRDAA